MRWEGSSAETFRVRWGLEIVGVAVKHAGDAEGTPSDGRTGQGGETSKETREHSSTLSPLLSGTLLPPVP